MTHNAAQLVELVKQQEKRFIEMDAANGHLVDFTRECLFARQQLLKNDCTLKVAGNNPNSLQGAILNVAAIGISLNPASQHAFLVPRKGSICLDISWRGLVKLATDCGAIKWAKAELVYENDTFEMNSICEPPTHKYDPFGDRGELRGGYCLARLSDDTFMVEAMPVSEIHKIRDTSEAYKRGGGPWVDWPEEMAKKTIVKRAYKSWPQSTNRERLDKAVEVINEHEGAAYTIEQHTRYMEALKDESAIDFFLIRSEVGTEGWNALFNSFPKGQKTKMKEKARELEKEGDQQLRDYIDAIDERAQADDEHGIAELLAELDEAAAGYVLKRVSQEAAQMIEATKEAA